MQNGSGLSKLAQTEVILSKTEQMEQRLCRVKQNEAE